MSSTPSDPIDCIYRLPADAGSAARVIVGINWTLVEGPAGCGLAHTPDRNAGGCRAPERAGGYTGLPLTELAGLRHSDNPFERSIAHAAACAFWNRYDLKGSAANGLDIVPDPSAATVIIGRFPDLERRLPNARVIEKRPGPGDYPESAAAELLAEAECLLITGSSLTNGSFARLLGLAPQAHVILLGPSTPLCPGLFEHGVNALSGLVLTDPAEAAQAVAEAGAVRALKQRGRYLTLFDS